MNDYDIMNKYRAKWLKELPGSNPPGTMALAAYARGFMDALVVALRMTIEENERNESSGD